MTAAFMPDGKTIVAASEDSILLFNTTSGHIRNLWHPGKANGRGRNVGLALSPDRRHIAYFSGQTVDILDATSGLSLMSLEHENWVSCVLSVEIITGAMALPSGSNFCPANPNISSSSNDLPHIWLRTCTAFHHKPVHISEKTLAVLDWSVNTRRGR